MSYWNQNSRFNLSAYQKRLISTELNKNTTGFGGATLTIYASEYGSFRPQTPDSTDQYYDRNFPVAIFTLPPAESNTIHDEGYIVFGLGENGIKAPAINSNPIDWPIAWFRITAQNGDILCDGYCHLLGTEGGDPDLAVESYTTSQGKTFLIRKMFFGQYFNYGLWPEAQGGGGVEE